MSEIKLKEKELEVLFMVDLETLSTMPNAVISEMGILCIGTPNNIDCETHTCLSLEVDVQEQVSLLGRHVDIETVEWWIKTDSKRFSELINPIDKITLKNALTRFSHYIGDKLITYQQEHPDFIITPIMWSQGTDFDFPILKTAFAECDMKLPYKYYDVRDLRTLRKESLVDTSHLKNESIKHYVANDILFQTQVLKYIKLNS